MGTVRWVLLLVFIRKQGMRGRSVTVVHTYRKLWGGRRASCDVSALCDDTEYISQRQVLVLESSLITPRVARPRRPVTAGPVCTRQQQQLSSFRTQLRMAISSCKYQEPVPGSHIPVSGDSISISGERKRHWRAVQLARPGRPVGFTYWVHCALCSDLWAK